MIKKYYFIHLLGLMSKSMRKLRLPLSICTCFNTWYHHYVMTQLLPLFNFEYYKEVSKSKQFNHIIWIFWWQGSHNMPLIVKSCIRSIIRNSHDYRVILLTKNNVKEYSKIPPYIYTKLNNRIIDITHFSDILRFNLLNLYGGIWMDATIYCTSEININIKGSSDDIYTVGGTSDKYNFFVRPKWTEFLIGGCKNNPVFLFMDRFLKAYWKYNNSIIDYFLADYALNYCYINNIGNFKYYTNKYSYNNCPHLNELQSVLNQKYDSKLLKYLTNNTNLFKLTYKMKFRSGNTFYHHIIIGRL